MVVISPPNIRININFTLNYIFYILTIMITNKLSRLSLSVLSALLVACGPSKTTVSPSLPEPKSPDFVISTLDDLKAQFVSHNADFSPKMNVRVKDNLKYPIDSIFSLVHLASVRCQMTSIDGTTNYEYIFNYTPAQRIVKAMRNNDFSELTPNEMTAYKSALSVADKARKSSKNILMQELYIHDWICKSTDYLKGFDNSAESDVSSVVGVFVNHQANCQGYSEAFYLLATMLGFEVDCVTGVAKGEPHGWNVIKINNNWYAVDVTWDDGNNLYISHLYLNAPQEIMNYDHVASTYNPHPVVKSMDDKYFFNWKSNSAGKYFKDPAEAINYVLKTAKGGQPEVEVLFDNIEGFNSYNSVLSTLKEINASKEYFNGMSLKAGNIYTDKYAWYYFNIVKK